MRYIKKAWLSITRVARTHVKFFIFCPKCHLTFPLTLTNDVEIAMEFETGAAALRGFKGFLYLYSFS